MLPVAEKGPSVESYALTVLKKKMTFLRVWTVVLTAAINAVDTVVEVDAVVVVTSSGTAR